MNNILVIAEKPSVALRIATAFGNGKFERKINKNISYYEINKTDKKMYVVAAVGHLFTIIGKHKNFPVLDVEWAPAYNTRSREYTKNYLDVIVDIAKKCNFFYKCVRL
jgi:Topoisomerase IA